VVAVLSTAGLASVALVLLILGRLTAKFEAVSRKQSYYYVFYFAAAVVVLLGGVYLYRIAALADQMSLVTDTRELLREQIGLTDSPHKLRTWFHLGFYYLPLAITMTVSLLLAWRSWGWLLRAHSSGPRARRPDLRARSADSRQDTR
jgi:hypothetical protein